MKRTEKCYSTLSNKKLLEKTSWEAPREDTEDAKRFSNCDKIMSRSKTHMAERERLTLSAGIR